MGLFLKFVTLIDGGNKGVLGYVGKYQRLLLKKGKSIIIRQKALSALV